MAIRLWMLMAAEALVAAAATEYFAVRSNELIVGSGMLLWWCFTNRYITRAFVASMPAQDAANWSFLLGIVGGLGTAHMLAPTNLPPANSMDFFVHAGIPILCMIGLAGSAIGIIDALRSLPEGLRTPVGKNDSTP